MERRMRKDMYGGICCLHRTPLPVSSSPLQRLSPSPAAEVLRTTSSSKLFSNSSITLCSRLTPFSRPSSLLASTKPTLVPCLSWGHHHHRKRNNKKKKMRTHLTATRNESPYHVLGVPPSATPQEIKRAYRKLALKYHPDVNKEANAEQKFMRIKHAYNILLNSESQQKYGFSNSKSNNPNSTSERSRSWKAQEEEEFYGFGNFLRDVQITIGSFVISMGHNCRKEIAAAAFKKKIVGVIFQRPWAIYTNKNIDVVTTGDLFRDLQVEFQNWEASAGTQEKPKSLWEELADIGEELVEFLEKELNITPDESSQVEKNSATEETSQSVQTEASKTTGTIEDNIDEIESTLEQLKRELGL